MSEPQPTQPAPLPSLSPKDNFLQLEGTCPTWRNVVRSIHTTTALTYALAEYATNSPSSERLAGVQEFVKILLNLAEPKSPPRGAFPEKRLTTIVADKTQQESKEKK